LRNSSPYPMPNRKAIARWTLWLLLLLPLAQVGGPLAWACSVRSHCAAKGGGCGGPGQPCGSACRHSNAPERSCCNTAVRAAKGAEADCACSPQAPTDSTGLLLLLAPELPVLLSTPAPQLQAPAAHSAPVRRISVVPLWLVALSPYGSRGPPCARLGV
jgi:hypothetical protein